METSEFSAAYISLVLQHPEFKIQTLMLQKFLCISITFNNVIKACKKYFVSSRARTTQIERNIYILQKMVLIEFLDLIYNAIS